MNDRVLLVVLGGSLLLLTIFSGCTNRQDDTVLRVLPQYTLSVSIIGGGTLTPDANGTYNAGSSITISAIPDVGYQFDRWEGTDNRNKTCANATAPHPTAGKCRAAITMHSNRNVQAYFKLIE